MTDPDKLDGLVARLQMEASIGHIAAREQMDGGDDYTISAMLADDAANAILDLRAEVARLTDALTKAQASYDDIYQDAITDAKSDAQEFEGELWKAVRNLMDETGFDWSGDVQFDGVTADEAMQHLRDCMDNSDALSARAEAAEAEVARLTNDAILKKAECDGIGSLLLDVQRDCIAERTGRLAAEAEVARLMEALAEIASISPHSGGDIHGMTLEHWRDAFLQAQALACAAEAHDKTEER